MSRTRFSRRHFLAGLGLSASFLPLLGSRPARAASGMPKRLIVIAVPNGVKEEVYWPVGGEYDFVLPTDSQVPAEHRYSPLQPLIPHREDIVFMGGIKLQNGHDSTDGLLGGHAALPFLLTGARGVDGPEISDGIRKSAAFPSLDRFVGKELALRHGLQFDSLVLKAIERFRGNDGYLSFDGPPIGDLPNAPSATVDPFALFDQLFGGASMDEALLELQRAKRRSVLDLVGRQIESFSKNLGTDDRQRIEQHLTSIRALERQLENTTDCSGPTLGLDPQLDYVNLNGNPNTPETMRAHMDMVVTAMACDMTRSASLLWPDSGGTFTVFHWLGEEFTKPGTDFANTGENQGLRNHHEIAHRDSEDEYMPLMNRVCQWYLEQFAYLVQKLKDTRDPDGSRMLDNTVVLFANLQRTGGGHHTTNLPWILAGSGGGYFKTGRFLPWLSGTQGQDVPQNGVLAAICNALDIPVDYYGSPDYGGELSVLRG